MNRIMDSQERLRAAMSEALGIYMAKEPKHTDEWRDKQWWEVWSHLLHEIEEVKRSGTQDRKYHNLLDLIGQAAICASWVRLHEE
jgi:hypothetical protein